MARIAAKIATFGLLTVVLAALAPADTIYFREGEQELGRLVAITPKEVQFESRKGTTVTPKADVLRVQLQRARQFDDVETVDQVTDPELKACLASQPSAQDFPAAGSVTLLERQVYDLTQEGVVVDTVRRIVKVLQQRGEGVATTHVWYFEDTDAPRIDFALTVTPDGRVLHLSDSALKNESIYAQFPEYRRLARFRFAAKEPRPGSILDIQHTVTRKLEPLFDPFHAEELFRYDSPILRKEVVVLVPEGGEGRVASQLSGPDVIRTARSVENGVVRLTWMLSEPQRGIVPEPLMPPKQTFVPMLTLGETATWEDLASGYAEALRALPALPDDVVAKAVELDTEGGAGAIHDFLARTIRTANVPQRAYRIVPHAPADTFRRGLANTLDKNFLFYKMLEAADIPCAFALVRGRQQGPPADAVPSLLEFNRSAVYLKGEDRFETVETEVLPCGALPGNMYGAPALVIGSGGSVLTATQAPRPEEELDAVRFDASLNDKGTLSLTVTYSGTRNTGVWMRNLKDADERELRNTLEQIAGYLHPSARLEKYSTTDLADLTVTPAITLECTVPGYAVKAGDLMLFDLPAVAYSAAGVGRPTRTHDLFWDHVQRETCEGSIRLPEGFTVYSMPEAVSFDSATASYSATLDAGDGTVTFADAYDLWVQEAPPTAYGEYKGCQEARANLPRQRIILTR